MDAIGLSLAGQELGLPSPPRFPAFSYVANVLIISYCLLCSSFKSRLSLCSCSGADIVTTDSSLYYYFSFYYWWCWYLMFIAEMFMNSGKPYSEYLWIKVEWSSPSSSAVSFSGISYWHLPDRSFRSQTFCLKIYSSLQVFSTFISTSSESHKNKEMLLVADNIYNNNNSIIICTAPYQVSRVF